MPILLSTIVISCIAGYTAAWIATTFLRSPLYLLGSWARLELVQNPGIAFGLRIPSPWQEILILVALAVMLFVARKSRTVLSQVGYGLIVGGALANVIDRLPDGFVTDYFAVGTFPIFNVPDSCITIGVALILAESMILVSRNR